MGERQKGRTAQDGKMSSEREERISLKRTQERGWPGRKRGFAPSELGFVWLRYAGFRGRRTHPPRPQTPGRSCFSGVRSLALPARIARSFTVAARIIRQSTIDNPSVLPYLRGFVASPLSPPRMCLWFGWMPPGGEPRRVTYPGTNGQTSGIRVTAMAPMRRLRGMPMRRKSVKRYPPGP